MKIENERKHHAIPANEIDSLHKLAREGKKLSASVIGAALTFKALRFQANSKILNIKINPTFEALIPALSAEEYNQLEQNLIADGCRDPLVVWQETNTLVDGHNRYKLCQKHNIPFNTIKKSFCDEEEVRLFIITNQLGKRNLPPEERARLALLLKPTLAAQAKQNLVTSTGGANPQPLQNSVKAGNTAPKANNTQKELAKIAGVSRDTISKVEKIDTKGIPELKKAAGKDISINQAAKIAQLPDEEQHEVLKTMQASASITKNKQKKSPPPLPQPADKITKTYYLTSEYHIDLDNSHYTCFTVQHLKSGEVRITVPADYAKKYMKNILNNMKCTRHKEPVDLIYESPELPENDDNEQQESDFE
jgi:transcriptional regulator with XRE-family HTH domain